MERPARRRREGDRLWVLPLVALAVLGCEEEGEKTPAAASAVAPAAEEETLPVVPKGPPEFAVDEISPKVGYSRSVLQKPDGKPNAEGLSTLKADLIAAKEHVSGKAVIVTIDRKAKPEWVVTYLRELAVLGPSDIEIQTETRPDYPSKVKALADSQADHAPKCSLVGMILEDRGTAIWRLEGGTARKRARGMGGPDLTMTGDTIKSMAKSCDSDLFFVQGAEGVEWGLIYDLGASGLANEDADLDTFVLLEERPVPGNPVKR